VRETRHGPVISDFENPSGPILAVAMANLQPEDTAAVGLHALNRARSVQEAEAAAEAISSPVQNLVVADAKSIALFTTGRVPVRKSGTGEMPAPGDGSADWVGWASGTLLPHSIAPASGRLVNANEPTWPPDFPVAMGRDTFGAWRADRIRALLSATDKHTAAGFAAMQMDIEDRFALSILPQLTALDGLSGTAAAAQAHLKGWDGKASMDRPAPLIFAAWVDAFQRIVLRQAGFARHLGATASDFVGMVLTPEGSRWCGGDCTPLLREALNTAAADLARRFGQNPGAWRWGSAHQAVFAHPLLRHVPVLGPATAIAIPVPGDSDTIDRGGTGAGLQAVHGASFRGVYDLSNLDASLFVIAPGQSGNPLNAHARDFVTRWRDGATITLGPTPAQVRESVRLQP